ncbi:E3 ubiquitin-protein ligase TRIM39-like isoform X2 [Osmerus eperlanus]
MSSSTLRVLEEQFQCSICLEVFTDPVSTSCGHNFCQACISGYWDSTVIFVCPLCKERFSGRPKLHVNTAFRDVVDQFKKMNVAGGTENTTERRTQRQIQKRLDMVQKIKRSVELSKKDYSKDIEDCINFYDSLVQPIQSSQAMLVEEIEEKQKEVEKRAEVLIKELEQEVAALQGGNTQVASKNWSEVSVHSDPGVLLVRGTVAGLGKKLELYIDKSKKIFYRRELKRIQKYAVDVTLNPDTAHPSLVLSADGKQVRLVEKQADVPDNPERFDSGVAVLGKEGFSSGGFYYEVQVGDKLRWDIGVACGSVDRKGQIEVKLQNGYVALFRNGEEYIAQDSPFVRFSLSNKPQKVGVFVDYEGGKVSFYDVGNEYHIYTFSGCKFKDILYPYINPCKTGSVALVITPVNPSD